MIVLGLDAGKHMGFAVLDVERGGIGRFIACGQIRETTNEERALRVDELLLFYPDVALVAVEVPAQLYRQLAKRDPSGKNLMQAMRIGAHLVGHLSARGYRVEEFTAPVWRRALKCTGTAKAKANARVATMLWQRVPNWPKSSNDHARDAGGAALFAGARMLDATRGFVRGRVARQNR